MKYLLIIFLVSCYSNDFAQAKDTTLPYLFIPKTVLKIDASSFPFGLDEEYKSAEASSSKLNCKIFKVFYHSSTIFDEIQIVLIDSSRFFCYFIGCMSRFYSCGYYHIKNDSMLLLQPARKVAKQIKGMISPLIKNDVKYNEINDTLFRFKNDMLSLVKKDDETNN